MRRWILILSMLRIKGAVLLLYIALIFYSEIEIAYFYLGLSFCVLQVLNLLKRSGRKNERGLKIRNWISEQERKKAACG